MDVPVIMQLKFQQSVQFDNVEMPQIQLSIDCSCFQLCHRDKYAQCKLCRKLEIPQGSSWSFAAPVVVNDRCQGWSRQCRSGSFTDAVPGRGCLARCAMTRILVQTVRKLCGGAKRKSDAFASLFRFSHLSRGLRAGAHFLGALDD